MGSEVPSAHDKMKKVLNWVAEELNAKPEKTKKQVLKEAEFKFDLSPQECEFLDKNFAR